MHQSTQQPCLRGERHGRTIVNGERALQLEISKVAQYEALARFGVPTPPTVAVIGREHIVAAAASIGYPLILKHNRAGKGLGVRLIYSPAALGEHLASKESRTRSTALCWSSATSKRRHRLLPGSSSLVGNCCTP